MKIKEVNSKMERLLNEEGFLKCAVPNANIIEIEYLTLGLENTNKHIEVALINQKEIYENIVNIGNDILKLLDKKNENTIFNNIFISGLDKTKLAELNAIIIKWCKENAYPYEIKKDQFGIVGEFAIKDFVFDTVTLYLFKMVNLYMIKIENLIDEYEVDKNIYLRKINKIKFIFTSICNMLSGMIEKQYYYNYDTFPYGSVKIEDIEKDITLKNYEHYFLMYRKIMAMYLQSFNSKIGNIIYYTNANEYDNQLLSHSCMDIAYRYFAYNEFINDLGVYLCKNPNCINRFYKIGNQEFCKDCISNGIPKQLRNKRQYQKSKSQN